MKTEQVIEEFIEDKEENYDQSWAGTCRRSAHHFLDWLEQENIDPQQIKFKSGDIENYHDYLREIESDWAYSTRKNHTMAVRELINFAVKNRHGWDANFQDNHPHSIYEADISSDEGESKLGWEDETGEEIPYIEEQEHQALLEENNNPRDDVILSILWDTGCRPAELRRLKLDDINKRDLMDDGKITVETAKRKDHTREVFLRPKTKSKLVFWLYKGKRNAYGNSAHSSNYVFPTQRTEKMSEGTINKQIKRIADRADIQTVGYTIETENYLRGEYEEVEREMVKINAKSYRHSFAVRACKRGINLSLLADLMGHSDTSSLESYTKFLPEDRKEEWERFIF